MINDNLISNTADFDIFEGITSISAVIKSVRDGLSNRKIDTVYFDGGKSDKKSRELAFLKHASQDLGFKLVPSDENFISSMVSGNTHGGLIMKCFKREYQSLNVNFLTSGNFYALIEGVEDPYNFGYSVRSLYAAGVDGIVLPQRNWLEISGTVARSSAGTSELAPIAISDPYEAVKLFKDNDFEVICGGIRDSVSLYDHDFSKPTLLIIGGEKRGISRKLLDLSDVVVRIPYGRDFMGSLPSTAAVSVMAFEIANKKKLLR